MDEAARQRLDAWRARREARRQKQRLENVGRAKRMREARLAFEKLESARKSGAKKSPRLDRIQIGCSGWYYWHWGQHFYAGIERAKWFDHYAKHFKTVELNAPFYSWPTLEAVRLWRRRLGRRKFIYTVKVCELITHVKRFARTKELVKDFYFIGQLLWDRMGCFLFQLPPSFRYSAARLRGILKQLDPRWRNVVEFRHKSWWNERVFAAFREAGVIFCSCSGPRLPDEMVETTDEVYIRFHGTTRWYRHDYSTEELAVWAERIRTSRAKRVWIYFNNDREGYAIKNAKELKGLLKSYRPFK